MVCRHLSCHLDHNLNSNWLMYKVSFRVCIAWTNKTIFVKSSQAMRNWIATIETYQGVGDCHIPFMQGHENL